MSTASFKELAEPLTRKASFAPWPVFSEDEVQAAARVLASGKVNYWTGEEGRQFEREFATSVGVVHAVAVANGSVALELALYALGIGPNDEVIVPSRSFIASATCVLARGATPVFADVDRESGNISAGTVAPLISEKTRAVIAVHLGGWPCEMEPLVSLTKERGLKLIEDCAQAQGASYRGKPVGSFGDVAAFSFCQDKIMSTGGEGGMLVTNCEKTYKRAWSYKDHGKNIYLAQDRDHSPAFRWLHDSVGTNWRLTEMQSALGRVMLPKIPARIAVRRRNAAVLAQGLGQIPALRMSAPPPHLSHAKYRYYAYVRPERVRSEWTRDRIQAAIECEGVPCSAGSCSEIYLEQALPRSMRPRERLPVAHELGETSLAFLVHPTLTEDDMHCTVAAVEKVLSQASV